MDDLLYQKAGDLEKGLQDLIRDNIGKLPPSEQEKISPDVIRMLQTVQKGKKVFIGAYDLNNPIEAFEAEKILNDNEMTILNSSTAFSPTGKLIYQMLVEVTPNQYQTLRSEFFPKPEIPEDPNATMWAKIVKWWRAGY